jgi:hypothetical protein
MSKEVCLRCPGKMCVDYEGGRIWTDLKTMKYYEIPQPISKCGMKIVESIKPPSPRKRRKEHFRDL